MRKSFLPFLRWRAELAACILLHTICSSWQWLFLMFLGSVFLATSCRREQVWQFHNQGWPDTYLCIWYYRNHKRHICSATSWTTFRQSFTDSFYLCLCYLACFWCMLLAFRNLPLVNSTYGLSVTQLPIFHIFAMQFSLFKIFWISALLFSTICKEK